MFPTTLQGVIPLLVQCLIFGLVVYAVYFVIDLLTLPANIKQIAKVIVAVVALIFLLQLFV